MKKVCIISLSENTQIYDLVTKQAIEPLVKKKNKIGPRYSIPGRNVYIILYYFNIFYIVKASDKLHG